MTRKHGMHETLKQQLPLINGEKINSVLRKRYLYDIIKPDVDKWERASIITSVLREENITMKQFADRMNVDPCTVRDWLLYTKITRQEHQLLKEQGLSDTAIFEQISNVILDSPEGLFYD